MADAWTGICFGEDAWNIPGRAEVVEKFRDLGITHVRLYHTYEATLEAFAGSGIQLTVGITNEDFVNALSTVGSARNWVNTYIVGHGDSNIVAVTVGNEVFSSAVDNVKNALLPSMQNLREALNQAGKSGIKVTTAHSFDVVTNIFPPSSGQFADTGRMQPLVNWLASVGSDFICNIYPYFTYMNSNGQITLQFGRLESGSVKDSNNGKIYTDQGHTAHAFDVVTNTFPPSSGQFADIGRMQPLVNWLASAYIFAMFDENQKDAGLEQSWGLYNPTNFDAKYTINFGNPPTLINRITPGMRLTSGQFVYSNNEVYRLNMQPDCNLVLYHIGVGPLWASKTQGSATDCYMELQHDGNAVVYGGGVARWASGTWGRNDGAHYIEVQDDGNTVMYNEANQAIWHTNTRGR
ncbi:hypothetical protein AXG93_2564s1000 [Marchantia polymorpha subsp. ruderalis]|uniref:Bulb-type lectin domain-containing protein n=1 Tax=Marchantia polymorpha subsp. ruderalis TaxID=1480154 RepID=A0A176WC55_MARPO|nr:hypothetical protein AXG93_2564s1000 [Marchantia polymorpha subsp. ruderalis]